jgi:hypothetical protein
MYVLRVAGFGGYLVHDRRVLGSRLRGAVIVRVCAAAHRSAQSDGQCGDPPGQFDP